MSSETVPMTNGYTYDDSLSASVTTVHPTRGGTAGGTTLTVTGHRLDSGDITVSIDGVACSVMTRSTDKIVCMTGPHTGSGQYLVTVNVGNHGLAQGSVEFGYVDLWSSRFTWGGEAPPEEGSMVVISSGQTVLLDTDTPVLKLLLIRGGMSIYLLLSVLYVPRYCY